MTLIFDASHTNIQGNVINVNTPNTPLYTSLCSIHATIQCLNTISRVEPNVTIISVTP
ncbi:hypothetical protein AB4K20DRAFT_1922247 [Rhizopus microsporus]